MAQGREIIEGPMTPGHRPRQERSMGPSPTRHGGGGQNITQLFALVVGIVFSPVRLGGHPPTQVYVSAGADYAG